MAENLLMFTSILGVLLHVTVGRRHLGRKCSATVTADSGKQGRRRAVALPPDLSKEGQWEQRCLFHNSIIDTFMVYQDRIETNFLHFILLLLRSTLLLNS